MRNKFILVLIAFQSIGMLTLLYFFWLGKTNAVDINQNILILLALFSVGIFFFGIVLCIKKSSNNEEYLRQDGIVKWYNPNKGFGFIELKNGEDVFVHQTEIRQPGFRYLNIGDLVEFEVGKGKKGPVALKVIRKNISENANVSDSIDDSEEYSLNQAP